MKNYIRFMIPMIIFLIAFNYITAWTETAPGNGLRMIIYSQELRPYVYRLLAPALARFLVEIFSARFDVSIWIIQITFAMGFYFSSLYLINTFIHDLDKSSFVAALPSFLIYALIIPYGKMYDMGTAFLFTLCLALLARRKFVLYCLAFMIGCFNRETMFLVIIFFSFYFMGKMKIIPYLLMITYQGIVFISIKILITMAFSDLPGDLFLFRPIQNFYLLLSHPVLGIFYSSIIGAIFILIRRDWKYKPEFLRSALLIILPIQIILHIILGYTFEFRVYIEIFPVMIMMIIPLIVKYPAWIECPEGCGDIYCTLHGCHTSDCPCPNLDDPSGWNGIDPYTAGGKPI